MTPDEVIEWALSEMDWYYGDPKGERASLRIVLSSDVISIWLQRRSYWEYLYSRSHRMDDGTIFPASPEAQRQGAKLSACERLLRGIADAPWS